MFRLHLFSAPRAESCEKSVGPSNLSQGASDNRVESAMAASPMTDEPTNPYAPPASDTDGAVWPQQGSDAALLADRGSRLGGAILDRLMLIGAALPGYLMILAHKSDLQNMFIGVALMAVMVLPLVIYQWYLISTTGQSLAKKWLRMRVVKVDGAPVDFVSGVLLRSWVIELIGAAFGFVLGAGGIGGGLTNVFGIVNALFIFGPAQRCLHDYIAGTKVVVA
jgi:uncharacterized RDD family membrane protein YckC